MAVKRGTVDRFAGDFAVIELEDKTFIDVRKDKLADCIAEGDKIYLGDFGKWEKDEAATDSARSRIRQLMDDLFE